MNIRNNAFFLVYLQAVLQFMLLSNQQQIKIYFFSFIIIRKFLQCKMVDKNSRLYVNYKSFGTNCRFFNRHYFYNIL